MLNNEFIYNKDIYCNFITHINLCIVAGMCVCFVYYYLNLLQNLKSKKSYFKVLDFPTNKTLFF